MVIVLRCFRGDKIWCVSGGEEGARGEGRSNVY